jgi:hypothetical protein
MESCRWVAFAVDPVEWMAFVTAELNLIGEVTIYIFQALLF